MPAPVRALALLLLRAPAPSPRRAPGARRELPDAGRASRPRVDFWTRVYTEVGTNGGLIHDNEDLSLVYEVVRVPEGASDRTLEQRADDAKARARAALRKLGGRAAPEPLRRASAACSPSSRRACRAARSRAAAERVRFQRGQADKFRDGLERMGRWESHIRRALRERGVPEDLKALPHVESSYNPDANSHAGAAGLWQFTRPTGRLYMRVDHIVDERRDPFVASEAAARLLRSNYERLGTWPLAITAYNHGPGGIAKAVRHLGTRDIGVIVGRYRSPSFGFASRNFYSRVPRRAAHRPEPRALLRPDPQGCALRTTSRSCCASPTEPRRWRRRCTSRRRSSATGTRRCSRRSGRARGACRSAYELRVPRRSGQPPASQLVAGIQGQGYQGAPDARVAARSERPRPRAGVAPRGARRDARRDRASATGRAATELADAERDPQPAAHPRGPGARGAGRRRPRRPRAAGRRGSPRLAAPSRPRRRRPRRDCRGRDDPPRRARRDAARHRAALRGVDGADRRAQRHPRPARPPRGPGARDPGAAPEAEAAPELARAEPPVAPAPSEAAPAPAGRGRSRAHARDRSLAAGGAGARACRGRHSGREGSGRCGPARRRSPRRRRRCAIRSLRATRSARSRAATASTRSASPTPTASTTRAASASAGARDPGGRHGARRARSGPEACARAGAREVPAAPAPAEPPAPLRHTIAPGDTLGSIARRYGVDAQRARRRQRRRRPAPPARRPAARDPGGRHGARRARSGPERLPPELRGARGPRARPAPAEPPGAAPAHDRARRHARLDRTQLRRRRAAPRRRQRHRRPAPPARRPAARDPGGRRRARRARPLRRRPRRPPSRRRQRRAPSPRRFAFGRATPSDRSRAGGRQRREPRRAANGIADPRRLRPGQRLTLPGRRPRRSRPGRRPRTTPCARATRSTRSPRATALRVADIAERNGLRSRHKLSIGQRLRLPPG